MEETNTTGHEGCKSATDFFTTSHDVMGLIIIVFVSTSHDVMGLIITVTWEREVPVMGFFIIVLY
jgi:hypothetical protein